MYSLKTPQLTHKNSIIYVSNVDRSSIVYMNDNIMIMIFYYMQ